MAISVRSHGALGNGIADDTAAFQSAIDAALAMRIASGASGSIGSGFVPLFVPAGFYRITGPLVLSDALGLSIYGEGSQASVLCLEAEGAALFEVSSYLNLAFDGIGFLSGSISISGGLPMATIAASAARTNVAFDFDSTSNGTDVSFDRCRFIGFHRVFQSVTSAVNGDFHRHTDCLFRENNDIWYNANSQAVCWSFTNCKAHHNERCFFNAGLHLTVRGGDFINPGDFYASAGNGSLGGRALFDNVYFENYQNINPSRTPRWLVLSGSQTGPIIFRDCWTRTGAHSLSGKTSAVLSGMFDVAFEGGYFDGNFDVAADSSLAGRMSSLSFKRMVRRPEIVQTLYANQGNTPVRLAIEDERGASVEFHGLVPGAAKPSVPGMSRAGFRYAALVNNNAVGYGLDWLPPAPYGWLLATSSLVLRAGTANTVVLTIWTDGTKTAKVWEKTVVPVSNKNKTLSIDPAEFVAQPTLTSSSAPLYFEISSTQNMGLVQVNLALSFTEAAG